MPHLTKRQHYVPAFYLRLWSTLNKEVIACHDLVDKKVFQTSPNNILSSGFFYEEDLSAPNNRMEKVLSEMESRCSAYFQNLHGLSIENNKPGNEQFLVSLIKQALTDDTCTAIKTFAAFQYLRVPGAIDQKRFELGETKFSVEEKDYLLNAGRFVDSGFSYIEDRFQALKLLIMISTGQDYITSDWPCFDLKYSDLSPVLGEEIGVSSEVIAYLPITPRLAAILYPLHYAPVKGHLMPPAHVITNTDREVRNQNTLVIQQAERYVIANQQRDFIFAVADKRKKSRNA